MTEATGTTETPETDGDGRVLHKGTLHVEWNGAEVAVGDAEFLVEKGRIVRIVSYIPQVEGEHDGEVGHPIVETEAEPVGEVDGNS